MEEYDGVIIDGPAGISRVNADGVRAADLVLIPAKRSPFDVWAVGRLGRSPESGFRDRHAKPRTLLGRRIEVVPEDYAIPAPELRTAEWVTYPQRPIWAGRCWTGGPSRPERDSLPESGDRGVDQ